MSRHGFSLPDHFTRDDLLEKGLTERVCDEVLAFREFLGVLGDCKPNDAGEKVVGPVWFAYAQGEISGGQALERLAEMRAA